MGMKTKSAKRKSVIVSAGLPLLIAVAIERFSVEWLNRE